MGDSAYSPATDPPSMRRREFHGFKEVWGLGLGFKVRGFKNFKGSSRGCKGFKRF